MTPQDVIQIVSTVGFPIAMCLILAWYIKTRDDSHSEQISRLNTEHKEEMSKMTEALNNNTLTIQKLVDLLSGGHSND